jgi:hypothetical protein
MRAVIQAMKQVSGPHYGQIINGAGLQRYRDSLPPADWQPAATTDELTQLYSVVYRMLGESPTRLLLRNYGTAVSAAIAELPWVGEMAARLPAGPPTEQLGWFVQELARFESQAWARQTVREDAHAWFMATSQCPICAGIQGAHAPICASDEAIYGSLARRILGRRVPVSEVECRAAGHPTCTIAFSKTF